MTGGRSCHRISGTLRSRRPLAPAVPKNRPPLVRDDGQIVTSISRAGVLRDVEYRDRTTKTRSSRFPRSSNPPTASTSRATRLVIRICPSFASAHNLTLDLAMREKTAAKLMSSADGPRTACRRREPNGNRPNRSRSEKSRGTLSWQHRCETGRAQPRRPRQTGWSRRRFKSSGCRVASADRQTDGKPAAAPNRPATSPSARPARTADGSTSRVRASTKLNSAHAARY